MPTISDPWLFFNNPSLLFNNPSLLWCGIVLLVLLGSQIDFDGSWATAAAATTLLIGGVVSCAAAMAGDNLHDLKAGYIAKNHSERLAALRRRA